MRRCIPPSGAGSWRATVTGQSENRDKPMIHWCDCNLLTARRVKPRIRPPLRSGGAAARSRRSGASRGFEDPNGGVRVVELCENMEWAHLHHQNYSPDSCTVFFQSRNTGRKLHTTSCSAGCQILMTICAFLNHDENYFRPPRDLDLTGVLSGRGTRRSEPWAPPGCRPCGRIAFRTRSRAGDSRRRSHPATA